MKKKLFVRVALRITVRMTVIASIAFAVIGGTVDAWAERRVAMVVGNASYKVANISLPNPRNDAEDVANVLKALGFEVIITVNASKRDMDLALQKFARLATDADSALFFYAGHAMQFQGRNFLMPTDAELEDEISVRYQTVGMEDVRAALDRANGVKIMILDACRNNPIADGLQKKIAGASRAVGATTRGLARVDKTQGMVVAYATAADDVAQDGTGRNSPFTTALLKRMQEPGLEIEMMFRRVASDVNTQTGGKQRPETYISLLSEYYLNQSDTVLWDKMDKDDITALREFIRKYPSSPKAVYASNRVELLDRLAKEREETARREKEARDAEEQRRVAEDRRRTEEEQKRQEAVRKLQDDQKRQEALKQQEEQKRQEAQRIENEKKRQEAQRVEDEKKRQEAQRVEDEKKRQEAQRIENEKKHQEAQRIEDEKKRQEALQRLEDEKKRQEAQRIEDEKKRQEARRIEDEKKRQEAQRIEDEKKRQEAQRIEDEKKRQEALRQQQEDLDAERQRLAALESRPQDVPATPVQPPGPEVPAIKANLPEQIRQAQIELKRLGCLTGTPDGAMALNSKTKDAVKDFWGKAHKPIVEVSITDELIADLKQHQTDFCVPPRPVKPAPPVATHQPHKPEPPVAAVRPSAPPPRPAQAASPQPTAKPIAGALGTGF
jgi:hypothetical protein